MDEIRSLKKRIYDLENQVEWFRGATVILVVILYLSILYLG